jgi:hypothetical protein
VGSRQHQRSHTMMMMMMMMLMMMMMMMMIHTSLNFQLQQLTAASKTPRI